MVAGGLFAQAPPAGFSTVAAAPVSDNFGSAYGVAPSLVLDSNGDPDVAFADRLKPNDVGIVFTAWSRSLGKFTPARKLFSAGAVASSGYVILSLARDASNNNLGLAYLADAGLSLHLAFSTDGGTTWNDQIVASDPANGFEGPSLAMGAGNFYLSYVHDYEGLRYVTGRETDSASLWLSQLMPQPNGFDRPVPDTSMALDSAGKPAIAVLLRGSPGPGFGLFFWRPGSTPVLAGDSRMYQTDFPAFRLSFFGTEPRLAFIGQYDDQYYTNDHNLFVSRSLDGGATFTPFQPLPNDPGASLNAPVAIANGSRGQSAIVADSNSSNGTDVCGTPKLSRSSDFQSWTTCGLAPKNQPRFQGTDPVVAFDQNDRLTVVFSVAAGGDLAYGVGMWREPLATGSGPTISAGGIVNAASFTAAVTPGSLASIFGSNFTTTADSAGNVPLPISLAGLRVLVNGTPAPLIYAGTTQINFQVPYEAPAGTASVVVTTDAGYVSAPSPMAVAVNAPGIFVFGANRAVVQNQDFSVNEESNPAKVGSTVTVYLTGSGPITNTPKTGFAAPVAPLSYVTSSPITAQLGDASTSNVFNAPVVFAGLTPSYVGLLQLNVTIPDMPAGNYPLVINIGGAKSNAPIITVSR